jgi:hypothetical protein
MRHDWTKKQLNHLLKYYPTCSHPRDLVAIVGHTYSAVCNKARKLGLSRIVDTRRPNTDTPQSIHYLKTHYLTTNLNQMSIALGRGESYVKAALKRHHLVQPPELIRQFTLNSRFKPGTAPANKGKKQSEYLSAEAFERTKATRFKKGVKKQNELYDGAVRIRNKTGRKYQFVRIAKNKWKMLQVVIWEKANGPVPKGYCVVFKNDNTLDCSLDNLNIISRQENMKRNSASLHLSDGYIANCLAWRDKELAAEIKQNKPLIELKRQQLKLQRTIYESQSQKTA